MMTPDDIASMLDAGASLVALNSGIRENGLRLLKESSEYIVANQVIDTTEEIRKTE
jgi:dihydroorotate dehydrogenase